MVGAHKFIIKYKGKTYLGFAAQKAAPLLLRFPRTYDSCNIEIFIERS